MRTLKSKGGFTLVELIVVIAILAILAGVAIPVYNGYITKAQDAAVVTELDAIQTAAQAANAQAGAISKVVVTSNSIKVDASSNLAEKYDTDFTMFYPNAQDTGNTTNGGEFTFKAGKAPVLTGTSYANGAVWVPAAQNAVEYETGKTLNCKAGWNAIPGTN